MKRLDAALSLIENCGVLADVGCDHGLLSKTVLDTNKADIVIASDISAPSLQKAKALLKNYSRIRFKVGSGITQICDTAVICGMGGHEIIKILKDCGERFKELPKKLILQPQNHAELVRQFLVDSGYFIDADIVAEEKNKFYFVMRAKLLQTKQFLTEEQLFYGAYCFESNELLARLLQRDKDKYDSYTSTEKNEKMKKIINDIMSRRS